MSTSKPSKARSGQVASREDKRHDVRISDYVAGLMNHDGSQIDECVVVVNTVSQQESACCAAHGHVENVAPSTERAKVAFIEDLDVLSNAKMIEVLHRSIRIKGDEKYPLFMTTDWMRDNLTGIVVGTLSNIYAECQMEEEPGTWPEIDRDTVWQMLELCDQHFGDDIPELVLAQHAREWLTQWMIMASHYLQRERKEAASLVMVAKGLVPTTKKAGELAASWHRNADAYLDELPASITEAKTKETDTEDDA